MFINLQMQYLLIIIATVLYPVAVTARFVHALPNLTWTNSLRSQMDLTDFLVGPHMFARETVTMDELDVIMGQDPKGDLTLFDLITDLEKKRTHHLLLISIPSEELFRAVQLTFRRFNKLNWIFLSLAVATGPNGRTPPFRSSTLEVSASQMLRLNISIGVEFSSEEDGAQRGYTKAHWLAMNKVMKDAPSFAKTRLPMIELNLYHVSYSTNLEHVSFHSTLLRFYFYVSFKNQNGVNLANFIRFYNRLGSENCFLNVPSALHKRILNYKEIIVHPTGKPVSRAALVWAEKISIYYLAVTLINLKILK